MLSKNQKKSSEFTLQSSSTSLLLLDVKSSQNISLSKHLNFIYMLIICIVYCTQEKKKWILTIFCAFSFRQLLESVGCHKKIPIKQRQKRKSSNVFDLIFNCSTKKKKQW